MASLNLKGVFTAIPSPFNEKGELCKKSLDRLIAHQLSGCVDGIITSGTTGESSSLSLEEKRQLSLWTLEAAQEKLSVIAGIGSNDTLTTVKNALEASSWGVHGLLIITPYYNRPTQEGLFRHFAYIAEKISTPIILYSNPARCVIDLSIETVQRLRSEFPHIIGIKDCGGPLDRIAQLIESNDPDFAVFSGDDDRAFYTGTLGTKGNFSVTSNIVPQAWTAMVKHLQKEELFKAREIHHRYLPLAHQLFIESNPIPVKYALYKMGIFESAKLRLPLSDLSPQYQLSLETLLKKLGLI